jgi:hypothetical protein
MSDSRQAAEMEKLRKVNDFINRHIEFDEDLVDLPLQATIGPRPWNHRTRAAAIARILQSSSTFP